MKPKDGIHLWIFQHALFYHQFRTTLFTFRNAFLGWLKNKFHCTFYIFFHGS